MEQVQKWILRSKAFWLSVIAILAGLSTESGAIMQLIQQVFGNHWAAVAASVFGVINIIVRLNTDGQATITKPEKKDAIDPSDSAGA